MISPFLKHMREKVIDWAGQQSSINAAFIAGSTERQIIPADEWADLDFEFFVTNFDEFLSDVGWIEDFAAIWTYLQVDEPDGPVFLVIYEGGEKVDFHFFQVNELERRVNAQALPVSYLRGYRIVVDKDGLAKKLPPPPKNPPSIPKPSEENFDFEIRAFWFGALYVAKQIHRRNLWVVKFRDWTMKENLLKIMEWYAQCSQNWEVDTWFGGHHIETWLDDQTLDELQKVFGHFSAEDSWRALFATMNLFRRLATDVADYLGCNYPVELDQKVTFRIEEIQKSMVADTLS
jgi:aminoglycoside 6-adenylyltransferase